MKEEEVIDFLRPDDAVALEFCINYISMAWNESLEEAKIRIMGYANGKDNSFCLVAKINDIPVGMMAFFQRTGIKTDGVYEPWSAGLYVIESCRKMGIGGRLLAGIQQKARLQGYDRVYLATDKEPLKKWYKGLGWKPIGKGSWKEHHYDVFVFEMTKRRGDVNIRPFTDEDAKATAAMHERTIRLVNSKDYPSEQIDAWALRGQKPERHLLRPQIMAKFVALSDGKIVGFADYEKDGDLGGLYVDADHQRQGIGTRLLKAIESHARGNAFKAMTLTSTVTAKDFYRCHGYQVIDEAFHKIGEQNLRVYHMKKSLV